MMFYPKTLLACIEEIFQVYYVYFPEFLCFILLQISMNMHLQGVDRGFLEWGSNPPGWGLTWLVPTPKMF